MGFDTAQYMGIPRVPSTVTLICVMIFSNDSGGIARNNGTSRDGTSNDGAGTDTGMITNGDGPDNDGAGAELDPVPHAGREKLTALAIRLVAQGAVVAQDAVTPHLHAVTDDDILRVIEAQAQPSRALGEISRPHSSLNPLSSNKQGSLIKRPPCASR